MPAIDGDRRRYSASQSTKCLCYAHRAIGACHTFAMEATNYRNRNAFLRHNTPRAYANGMKVYNVQCKDLKDVVGNVTNGSSSRLGICEMEFEILLASLLFVAFG